MPLTKQKERRICQRLTIPLKVRYKAAGKGNKERQIKCLNISGVGMRIETKEGLKAGQNIDILVYLPGEKKLVTIHTRVVWSEKNKDGYWSGLKFLKIEPQTEFTEFLCEKILDISSENGGIDEVSS